MDIKQLAGVKPACREAGTEVEREPEVEQVPAQEEREPEVAQIPAPQREGFSRTKALRRRRLTAVEMLKPNQQKRTSERKGAF